MSKKLERKTQKEFAYEGFGFPVVLLRVPMVRVRGAWTPDVNYDQLARELLEALALKPGRLTGNEVRFIRHSLSMTLQDFAGRFGGVTHPAVIKWEQAENDPTTMNWAVEKDIRLEILRSVSKIKPREFLEAYSSLAKERTATRRKMKLTVGAA